MGLCYYTVLLLTDSIYSLYCKAEFRLHIFPIEPDTVPLPFNSSLYGSIFPASRFIIKTSSPWLEGSVYLRLLKSVPIFIFFVCSGRDQIWVKLPPCCVDLYHLLHLHRSSCITYATQMCLPHLSEIWWICRAVMSQRLSPHPQWENPC